MSEILLNGKKIEIDRALNLEDALKQWQYDKRVIAVAINETFVPRSRYEKVILQTGDNVDIVNAVQGG